MRKLLIAGVLLLGAPAAAQDVERGRQFFLDHCATCHGPAARGDGPMAEVLSVPPADLTRLAAENGGTFPAARVVRRIDGREEVLAHGGPMPLFGLILDGPSGIVVTPEGAEIIAPEAIVDIAAWLASVQL